MYVLTNGSRVRFHSPFWAPIIVLGISGPKNDPHIGKSAVKHLSAGNKSHVTNLHHRGRRKRRLPAEMGRAFQILSFLDGPTARPLALHDALGHRPGPGSGG